MSMQLVIRKFSVICLTCGVKTSDTHLGVDICRACTAFYRRTLRSRTKELMCKTGHGNCSRGRQRGNRGASCMKCRHDRIMALLRQPECVPLMVTATDLAILEPALLLQTRTTPLLDRLREAHRRMIERRIEMEAQSFAENPLISLRELPSTSSPIGLNECLPRGSHQCFVTRLSILITAMHEFAAISFDHFKSRNAETKWALVRGFYETFAVLEKMYRSEIHFPDNDEVYFNAYTTLNDMKSPQTYFEGFAGDVATARRIYKDTQGHLTALRWELRRAPIESEIEMVAAIALEMWNSDTYGSLPEPFLRVLDAHRRQLLKDLHIYYTKVLGIPDYATRIGRLFSVIQFTKETLHKIRENFEMYALLGVSRPGTLEFQLLRS